MVIYNPKSMRLTEFREKGEFDFPQLGFTVGSSVCNIGLNFEPVKNKVSS